MYVSMYLCLAARAGVVQYGSLPPLSAFTLGSVHACFDRKCCQARNARQWLARGIPMLQRISSIVKLWH